MRLIYVRHGRTEWNTAGRFQGATDIDLDEVGRAQAARMAPLVARARPRIIVSSDLRRAVDTATAVAQLVGVEVQVDQRLRERGYGPWEGLTRAQIAERYPAEHAAWLRREPFCLDGIESPDEVARRGVAAMQDVVGKLGDDDTALVVGHGGASRQSIAAFLGWATHQVGSLSGLGNCHWADLRKGQADWFIHGYNISAEPGQQ